MIVKKNLVSLAGTIASVGGVLLPGGQAVADWPMKQRDMGNTGRAVKWKLQVNRFALLALTSLSITVLATAANSDVIDWLQPADGDFHDAANWQGDVVPGQNDTARFLASGTQDVYGASFSADALTHRLEVLTDVPIFDFHLGGFSYTITDRIRVDKPGWFFITGGGEVDAHFLDVKNGTVQVSNAHVEVELFDIGAGSGPSSGQLKISGADAEFSKTACCNFNIGWHPGNSGSMSVEGGASVHMQNGPLAIGREGATGTLTIASGSSVTNVAGTVAIGTGAASTGTVHVTDDGTTWATDHTLAVGSSGGTGSLYITDGASVSSHFADVGAHDGAGGFVHVSGTGSSWTLSEGLFVGKQASNGQLQVDEGATISSPSIMIGDGDDAVAPATISGSKTSVTGLSHIGYRGHGILLIENGAHVSSINSASKEPHTVFLGESQDAVGHVVVTDDGSRWDNIGMLVVGSVWHTPTNGEGTLTIDDGAQVESASGQIAVYSPESSGSVVVSGAGSQWTTGYVSVGSSGEGELLLSDGGTVDCTRVTVGENGMLSGNGIVDGELRNIGLINAGPMAGSLSVTDDFIQGDEGVTRFTIGSEWVGPIAISGSAALAGTLELDLDGFDPEPAVPYDLFTFTSRTGQFDQVVGLDESGMTLIYTDTAVSILLLPPVEALVIDPVSLDLAEQLSRTVHAIATVTGGDDIDVTHQADWSSDDESIASVDDIGLVTAHSLGSTVITAEYDGFTATANVNVVKSPVTFTPVTGDDDPVWAHGMSGDGSVLVGYVGTNSLDVQAVRYSREDGLTQLAPLFEGANGEARAASQDGSVLVGRTVSADPPSQGTLWSPDEPIGIGYLPGWHFSDAWDVSADGSIIVGYAATGPGIPIDDRAFRWTESDGFVALADKHSNARGISADGSVIVGSIGNDAASPYQAYRWTKADGLVELGFLNGKETYANSVSGDGSTIVGGSPGYATENEAIRWTSETGFVGLGYLDGDELSVAADVSYDGSVIVGRSFGGDAGERAFIWTPEDGMHPLKDVLIDAGAVGLEQWTLTHANGVSDDGRSISGMAIDPAGQSSAYLVTLPGSDSLGDLTGDGVVNVADLLVLLGDWGPCPRGTGCAGDLNSDGQINVADLLILLGNWG